MLHGKADRSRPLGEVAFDITVARNALKSAGVSDQTVAQSINDVLRMSHFDADRIADLKKAVELTAGRWDSLDDVPTELAIQNLDLQPRSENYFDQVAVIVPDGGGDDKPPDELQPGDIAVAPSAAPQYVQIPVDGPLLDKGENESAMDYLASNAPPLAVPDNPATRPEVALLTSQSDEVTENCTGGAFAHWGSVDFARDFRNAAIRSRMLSYSEVGGDADAEIVVVDSGFIRAKIPGVFREDLLKSVGELDDQVPPQELDERRRVHGTAVAGLALGGPDLYALGPALGLKIKVRPARIFKAALINGKSVPDFSPQLMDKAMEAGGDIFNMSFASKDKQLMDNFRTKFLMESREELFVVAAGNNNMNDDTKGVDLAATELRPQFYGGNAEGPNLILVAAIDGTNLPAFRISRPTRFRLEHLGVPSKAGSRSTAITKTMNRNSRELRLQRRSSRSPLP